MKARTRKPRIHITAVASSAARDIHRLGVGNLRGLTALAQSGAGPDYEVTVNERMILCEQDDMAGGRCDDAERAKEVETVLSDDSVAAMVTIRGGAWFTRILDRIDFDVLARRKTTIHIFGFSEMTTLIAIAARYPRAVALYDLGPAFLFGGMEDAVLNEPEKYARGVVVPPEQLAGFAAGWALARYPAEFAAFFHDVANILDGKGSSRAATGRVLAGNLPAQQTIRITGGCLSVVVAILGTQFAEAVETRGKWIALEDVNEAADPLDRMMASLKLNGLFERAEGIILGDFHDHHKPMSDAAFRILQHHLPARRKMPIIRIDTFGHVYPIAPLPLHREVILRARRSGRGPQHVELEVPWSRMGRQ